jgi:hypothetical protein
LRRSAIVISDSSYHRGQCPKSLGYYSIPTPESETLKGLAVALVVMVSVADLLAATSGRNVTPIVQEVPAAKFAGQLFVCGNLEA